MGYPRRGLHLFESYLWGNHHLTNILELHLRLQAPIDGKEQPEGAKVLMDPPSDSYVVHVILPPVGVQDHLNHWFPI